MQEPIGNRLSLSQPQSGRYRRTIFTCWVRVPNPGGRKTDDAFLSALKREVGNRGLLGFPLALTASWKASSAEAVVKRTLAEESGAFAEAEKTFRLIERETALKFTLFTREELWAAVYFGHRMNAASMPTAPNNGSDIREYLCGEAIESCGPYVMHSDCPAAIVTLFTPPQPFVTADALRLLSANGTLNFRHTIISEFIYPNQNKGVKRLDRRIRRVMRSAQSISGRYKLSPEASIALQDLGAIRQELAGSREALAQVRFYVIVYGESARTRSELVASLKNLDRYCEQITTEIRKINGADADREAPAALSVLYPKGLVGEADDKKTTRKSPKPSIRWRR